MKKISVLTLELTEKCNFSCSYCPQRGGERSLKDKDIQTFLDFIAPRLAKEVWLGFYGGEPLLAWPLIVKTVAHAQKNNKSKFHFTLTSNCSLLKEEHILFFKENRFDLVISYDGLAQGQRDRKSVTVVEKAMAVMKEIYPAGYTINSVFTPRTLPLLADSMKRMLDQGHRRVRYALDMGTPWDGADFKNLERQLERLAKLFAPRMQEGGGTALENFKSERGKGVFACFAGRDRLALLPDRTVWGCYLFYDLLKHSPKHPEYKKYCFGKLPAIIRAGEMNQAVTASYNDLRQDYFFTARKNLCCLCPELEKCAVCPAVAAMASGRLGVIPDWICRIKQLQGRFRTFTTAVH
jgi:uncharacterized protein